MLSDTGDDEHKDKDENRPTIRGKEARNEYGNEDWLHNDDDGDSEDCGVDDDADGDDDAGGDDDDGDDDDDDDHEGDADRVSLLFFQVRLWRSSLRSCRRA